MALESYFEKEKIDIKKLAVEALEREINPELLKIELRESKAIEKFFGEKLEAAPLPEEITPERYREWREKGFELHYLPPEELSEDRDLPGWQKKPGKRYTPDQQHGIEFFDEIKNGNLPKDAAKLPGSWILIDEREKPRYQARKRVYKDDLLAAALEDLRKKNVISDYQIKNSRFNTSHNELHKPEVKEAIAQALGVDPENLRLPRAIEWNYLGNAFYHQWSDGEALEWFEDDYQKGQRTLYGGDSRHGGLSYMNWGLPDGREYSLGFRPLVIFPKSGERKTEEFKKETSPLPEVRKF